MPPFRGDGLWSDAPR
jgi:hypothetical protein